MYDSEDSVTDDETVELPVSMRPLLGLITSVAAGCRHASSSGLQPAIHRYIPEGIFELLGLLLIEEQGRFLTDCSLTLKLRIILKEKLLTPC